VTKATPMSASGHLPELVREIEAALPTLLTDLAELSTSVAARVVEIRAALTCIPQTRECAAVRARVELPLLQVEVAAAALHGEPTGKLQGLVRDLERARKHAKKGK
jgi:hypothetical protein